MKCYKKTEVVFYFRLKPIDTVMAFTLCHGVNPR